MFIHFTSKYAFIRHCSCCSRCNRNAWLFSFLKKLKNLNFKFRIFKLEFKEYSFMNDLYSLLSSFENMKMTSKTPLSAVKHIWISEKREVPVDLLPQQTSRRSGWGSTPGRWGWRDILTRMGENLETLQLHILCGRVASSRSK